MVNKEIYAVIVPKESSVFMMLQSGLFYESKKIQNQYFCMIKMEGEEPLIMYTEKHKEAIFYTSRELKKVVEYLNMHNIKHRIIDASEKTSTKKQNPAITEISKIEVTEF